VVRHWNNRARNVDRGDVRERMRAVPGSDAGSEDNRVRFIRIEGMGVRTAPGVHGSETILKTMDLTEEIGWGKRNVKLCHQQIAAKEQKKWKQ